jgi:peroxiredoxin
MSDDGKTLNAGTAAPDFELPSAPDQEVRLSNLAGKPVILAFYPADWSPVCGDQMALYNEVLPEFKKYGRSSAESPSTASGAIRRFHKRGTFSFRCLPTSNQRAPSLACTASTGRTMASPSERCS